VTSEDVRSELERVPFLPVRLHLVSGKTIDVPASGTAWMVRNSVMIFQNPQIHARYNMVALRNIEQIEQLPEEG
jgi:hypothetical protein